MLGLEDERTVFARYQAIRRAEREYLPEGTDPSRFRNDSSLPIGTPNARSASMS